MNLSSLIFHRPAPVAAPLRDLTRAELNDIARLEQAVAVHRAARKALLTIGIVDARITYDPVDSASRVELEIEQLEESICEIRRQVEADD